MSLYEFIDDKSILGDKYKKYLELKDKLTSKGTPDNLAEYEASKLLTPDKLEKINIAVKNSEGRRIGVTFFFDEAKELELLARWFNYNPHVGQVKDAKLLLLLLKMMEEL